ncbi:MAG: DNA starvation/stationary phase protection protein [Bacteroidia bacterium]|nr:DNA starvation/stationary phase protection protein [Bacteroidia bacterium]NNL32176.1 DNA starvation/stationary phase protection protein [Flavobacteriaceae bacterium]
MDYLNIKDDERMPVVVELNKLLADYHIYYQKLRNFHWNILGKSFFDLHIKFEELYTDAQVKIDEIAERILTLRFHPMSNLSDYLNITSIKESSEIKSDLVMVTLILKDHKKLLTQMSTVISKAEEAKDEGTIDLIGAYIRDLEKASWMLDAWSKKASDKLNQEILQS